MDGLALAVQEGLLPASGLYAGSHCSARASDDVFKMSVKEETLSRPFRCRRSPSNSFCSVEFPVQLLTVRYSLHEIDVGRVQEKRSADRLRKLVIGLNLQDMGLEIGLDAQVDVRNISPGLNLHRNVGRVVSFSVLS